MEDLNQWLTAKSRLDLAVSDFLSSCTTLKAAVLRPPELGYSQNTLEDTLYEVQSQISSIDIAESRLKESRVTLNKILNLSISRVPLHRLPSEILGVIFIIAVDPPICYQNAYTPQHALLDIQLVCMRWYRIASNTPRLWSHIDVDLDRLSANSEFSLNRTRLWLDRSCDTMTHLHLAGQSRIPQDAISELVSVLQPRLALLHSLNVTGAYTYHLVRELLKVYSSRDTSRVLKCLTLSYIQISPEDREVAWPTSSLSRLVELDLNCLSGVVSLLFSQLVALLSNCPTLHILRLESLSTREDHPQDYPVISLPLLRIFEFSTYEGNPSELQLLSLLSPGPYPLDVRLYLYNMIEPAYITSHIGPLLMRSNVTRLTVLDPYLGHRDNRFETLLSSTPRLRALILHQAYYKGLVVLKELIAPSDGSNQRLPQLQCLCLVYGDCGPKSRESLKRIVATRSLNSLIFLTCRFTTLNPDEATSYNGDAWDTTQPEAVPEDFRQQLSEHVKKWVVLPRPHDPSQRNVDSFVEEVITLD